MSEERVAPLTLVWVRHGVTDMTVEHRFSGSGVPGPGLNAQGRVQAARAADALHRIGRKSWERLPSVSRLFASPMTRTQDTAGALSRRLGVHVETDARVREVEFGEWEGLHAPQIHEKYGDALPRWRHGDGAPPGGESLGDVRQRVDGAIVDWAAQHAQLAQTDDKPRTWAVASHAVAIKSAVSVSFGVARESWGALWPEPASYTILQLRVRPDGTIVERDLMCFGVPTD